MSVNEINSADRVSVSHITDDAITAGADAIADLLSLLGVDPDEEIEGGDAPPVGRQLAELVLQAGALVSPEQTTDHATSSVSPVSDDMVERVEQAWPRIFLCDTDWRGKLRALIEAALAGCTVVVLLEPDEPHGDELIWTVPECVDEDVEVIIEAHVDLGGPVVFCPFGEITPAHTRAVALAMLAAADRVDRLAAEPSGGSQVGDQHDG